MVVDYSVLAVAVGITLGCSVPLTCSDVSRGSAVQIGNPAAANVGQLKVSMSMAAAAAAGVEERPCSWA